MNKLGLKKISSKRKGDKIMDSQKFRSVIMLTEATLRRAKINTLNIKNNRTLFFKKMFCFGNDLFIDTTS